MSSQLAIGADLTSDAGVKSAARSFQARASCWSRLASLHPDSPTLGGTGISTQAVRLVFYTAASAGRAGSEQQENIERVQAGLDFHLCQIGCAHPNPRRPYANDANVLQEAAGAFGYLQARVVPQLTTPRPEDLSQECTGMLAALCMAQVRIADCCAA